MLNGTDKGGLSLQSSPVKASPSPVRASSSPVRVPSSPLKSSLSPAGKQRSPRRCQFAPPIEDARDKCGSSWLCRRGAGAEVAEDSGSESPGPSASLPLPQGCEESAPPPKNCFRLVMLGSARVGKTSLVARFLGTKFEDCYTPTIEDFHRKLYRIRGEVYQLDLLDTSGNHPFPAMRRLSFLTGDLFVLVFAMDCRESFEEVIRLREQILETKASASSSSRGRKQAPRVPMAIAGNKCDRDLKTVQPEEASAYCATQDSACVFVETSAKRNFHVDDLFYELFVVANLPLEMAPNHHKRVSTAFGSPCTLPPTSSQSSRSKKCTLSIKRRLSDACGVVAPNVRRPSIRTDLMIMRTKTCAKGDNDSVSGSPKLNLNRLVRSNPQNDKRSCAIQ
ncbi:GTP-binding protein Rhes [Maniola jurtina]|uniref:GTP-binding protein Rhes n=1 Tax=Maniola jurtina TaxID=191418 RepID=UPI001E68E7B5|nr:GTP-binding protein Rhes [Maniola jurtina]XP_045766407.1 GTP-binding protein Rhes [Maniola jurtina]